MTADENGAGGNSKNKKMLLGGAVGLGVAGILLFGLVIINDRDDPLDEPEPGLGLDVLREGVDDTDEPFPEAPSNDGNGSSSDPPGDEPDGGDDQQDNDVLVGDESDELLTGGDDGDDLLGGEPDDLTASALVEPILTKWCADVEHQPPPGQEDKAASGVWVAGEVYGLPEGTWIWVEGPTLNNGDPTRMPIENNQFGAPLGINSYGAHPFDRFEAETPDGLVFDFLPALQDAGLGTFEVDADEGPIFGSECEGLNLSPTPFGDPDTIGDELTDDSGDATDAPPDPFVDLDAFFDEFAAAHREGDIDHLRDTLHPVVPDAFGAETCDNYLIDTLGSIDAVTVLEVKERGEWVFDTPEGPTPFPDAFTVDVEFTIAGDGSTLPLESHVPIEDGQPFWLTTCGVEVP